MVTSMKRTFSRNPVKAGVAVNSRPYSDMLIDMYEDGAIGSETIISLINYMSDQDIADFMRKEELLDEED